MSTFTQVAASKIIQSLAVRRAVVKIAACIGIYGATSTKSGYFTIASTPGLCPFLKFTQPKHLLKEAVVLALDYGMAHFTNKLLGPKDFGPLPSGAHLTAFYLDFLLALPQVVTRFIPGLARLTNAEYKNFYKHHHPTLKASFLIGTQQPARNFAAYLVDLATGSTPFKLLPQLIVFLHELATSTAITHMHSMVLVKFYNKFEPRPSVHMLIGVISSMAFYGIGAMVTELVTNRFVQPVLAQLQMSGEPDELASDQFPLLSEEMANGLDKVPMATITTAAGVAVQLVDDTSTDNSTRLHALALIRQLRSYIKYATERKHRLRAGPLRTSEATPYPNNDSYPCMLCGDKIVNMQSVCQVAPCGHVAHKKCADESKLDVCLLCHACLEDTDDEELYQKKAEKGIDMIRASLQGWGEQPLLPPVLAWAPFSDAAHYAVLQHKIPKHVVRMCSASHCPNPGGAAYITPFLSMLDCAPFESTEMLKVPVV